MLPSCREFLTSTPRISPTAMAETLAQALTEILVCPRDKLPLSEQAGGLVCSHGHRYAVVEGIPILLLSEATQTHIEGGRSLAVAEAGAAAQLPQFDLAAGEIDPFVKNAIGATNGSLYRHLVGKLKEYPIPSLRLPPGQGKLFLEIGCSWGRWCVAAARSGYRPIGIDPSLKGIRAARRVARQLGVDVHYIVADGRYLPFPASVFDQVFSFSVLQHLSREDVRLTLLEICRVLRLGGECQVQMPNAYGVRCLYHQARRGFREARDFEVRYWTARELLSTFRAAVGPARISVDGYFSLNAQSSDVRLLPRRYRALVHASESLRRASEVFLPLAHVADSLYVTAVKS
jgi:SAM-dependent methyltransferase/uncharacterized protein YbaR (Trm112 family)